MAKATKTATKRSTKAAKSQADDASAAPSGKTLVVVESPAKAKTINRYLGRDYIVRASMGHVRDLPERKLGVDIEHDFAPSYEPLAGRKKVLAELKKYAKAASEVLLATDLDREGEAIAWHLAESLGVPANRVRRVIFNEITAPAIREAFAHPRDIDMNKVNAQQARRILDRIVGYEVSPLLWKKVARGLSAGRVQSVAVRLIVDRERDIEAFTPEEYWRIGAVFTTNCGAADYLTNRWQAFQKQTNEAGANPTREKEQEFLAEHQAFRADLVSWKGQRFKTDSAEMSLEIVRALGLAVDEVQRREDPAAKGPARNCVTVTGHLQAGGPAFVVRSLQQRDSRSRPSAPLTTAALQQAASVQLRFSASRTMRIAQQLYEGVEIPGEGSVGLITYMRTDSTHLSAEAIGAARKFIGEQFGAPYLPEKPNVYAAGQRAQEAHEAIRPSHVERTPDSLMGSLTEEQYKLYRLIWQRFVACQMTPAVWKVTEADIVADTSSGAAVFKAMGRQLAFDGFMRVTGLARGGDQVLPPLQQDLPVAPVELSPTQHFTQPPPRFTEASLVKALEADGIGRPSTYAAIIQTIQDREYVRLLERAFHPTDLGTIVTDKLVKHLPDIFDIRFTAHMENQLDKVEDSSQDWRGVLRDFYGPFSRHLKQAGEEMVHAKAESAPSEYVCEACGKPMVYRFSKNGRYLACSGYPDCKTTAPVDADGKKVLKVQVPAACPLCGTSPMVLRRSRFGSFLGCSKYPDCKGTLQCDSTGQPLKVVKEEDLKEVCPDCGGPMGVKWKGRRAFLGCNNYPQCKATAPIPEGISIQAPPKAEPKPAGVNCPKCKRPMLIRDSRRGEFLACSGFPRCRNAMNLDKLDELKAAQAGGAQPAEPAPEGDKPAKPKAAKKASTRKK
ncbi:MAG: type I DNA topoisomerase [Phycisphaerae bacterium]|jgi:DNA topoisomerase-1